MTNELDNFPCTKCGGCCRKLYVSNYNDFIRHILSEQLQQPQPPLPTKESDGSCLHLKEDNTCAIYEDRPTICRLSKNRLFLGEGSMQEKLGYTDLEYKDSIVDACNKFVSVYKMDDKFRIEVDDPERVKKNAAKIMGLWAPLISEYYYKFKKDSKSRIKGLLRKAKCRKTNKMKKR